METRVIELKLAVEEPQQDYLKCICLSPEGEAFEAHWISQLGEWVDSVGVTHAPHKGVTQWYVAPEWLTADVA